MSAWVGPSLRIAVDSGASQEQVLSLHPTEALLDSQPRPFRPEADQACLGMQNAGQAVPHVPCHGGPVAGAGDLQGRV